MAPDPGFKHVDFSLQCSGSLTAFNNFPTGNLTISFWIRFARQKFDNLNQRLDTSNHRLVSYDDRSTSDHPNAGGSSILILDPSNITLGFAGNRMTTGARVD